MQIFDGNDAFLTTEYLADALRLMARADAEQGEYNPAEHTCWIAADAIDLLVKMACGESPSLLLKHIARWAAMKED